MLVLQLVIGANIYSKSQEDTAFGIALIIGPVDRIVCQCQNDRSISISSSLYSYSSLLGQARDSFIMKQTLIKTTSAMARL